MNVLVLGLYVEGRSDERFLPIVIQRTSQVILAQHERIDIEPLQPIIVRKYPSARTRKDCILQAAREAVNYDALVVHSDADDRTYQQTRSELFDPGYEEVQQIKTKENICKDLLPIIPVRMVEAWMLVDPEALRKAMKTKMSLQTLGLPEKVKQVESYRDPKEMLKQMVRKVYPNRPKLWNRIMAELYDDLAPLINLERLKQVPSYQQFVNDLTETLIALNILPRIHRM